jgi:serine/threonine protein kinase
MGSRHGTPNPNPNPDLNPNPDPNPEERSSRMGQGSWLWVCICSVGCVLTMKSATQPWALATTPLKVADFGSACSEADAVHRTYIQSRFYRAPEVIVAVRCAFLDWILHSMMTLSFTPLLRLKRCHACGQLHSSRVSTFLPVDTVHCVQILKATATQTATLTLTPTPTINCVQTLKAGCTRAVDVWSLGCIIAELALGALLLPP